MVEPRHRAIVDVERETLFDQAAERKPDSRLDRAAVTDGDDILAGFAAGDFLDRAGRTIVEIHKTLATGRGLADVGEPMAAGRAARDKRRAIHPLPSPEMLLGERGDLRHHRGLWKTRLPDRFRGLVGTLQI